MLNAFRHQSGSHAEIEEFMAEYDQVCSTPSGIKAVLTGEGGTGMSERRCSTPSGIKAVLTPSSPSRSPRATRAQRLPASKRFSRTPDAPDVPGRAVLNAFRHQSGSHILSRAIAASRRLCSTPSGIKAVLTCGVSCQRNHRICAQRLPASKRFSQLAATRLLEQRRVLNAFRHQSGSH